MTLVLVNLALVFANLFYFALVVNLLWGWYMVPLGMPILNYAHMVGILALISLLRVPKKTKVSHEDLCNILWTNLLFLSFTLGLGLMFKSWI